MIRILVAYFENLAGQIKRWDVKWEKTMTNAGGGKYLTRTLATIPSNVCSRSFCFPNDFSSMNQWRMCAMAQREDQTKQTGKRKHQTVNCQNCMFMYVRYFIWCRSQCKKWVFGMVVHSTGICRQTCRMFETIRFVSFRFQLIFQRPVELCEWFCEIPGCDQHSKYAANISICQTDKQLTWSPRILCRMMVSL